jgi:hypothetical protein
LFANRVSNAWTAGASYYNTASNIASQIGWGGAGQFGLDILASSEIPVASQAAGAIGAVWYASQCDAFGAGSSLTGMIPVAGIAGDAARMGRWADKGIDLARQADNIPGPVLNAVQKQGGRYDDLIANGAHRHHMPSDQASPLAKGDGPAIRMEPADHRRTASYGGGSGSPQQQYRDQQRSLIDQGKFDDAFLMDVQDIQSKFGSKYDQAILEAIDALSK